MKKLILFLSVLSFSFTGTFANEPEDAFAYNENQINSEFEQLNKIEAFVQKNEGTTIETIKAENENLLQGISLNEESAVLMKGSGSDLFGIPAFLWGCVLGVIGLLLVYILTDNDRDQVKKAVMGCLVSTVAGVVIYFVAIAGSLAN